MTCFNATDGIPGRVTVALKLSMDSGWRYRAGSGSYNVAVGVISEEFVSSTVATLPTYSV